MNPLTRNVGLRVGPIVLDTLVKHYFERIKEGMQITEKEAKEKVEDEDKEEDPAILVQLRQDELLYDEAFAIIKAFLAAAALHTVEELQDFSNTRTPSPPWVHVLRVVVPMSCCDEAAGYLVKALGGEDVAKRVVGGVKWWQVRAIRGVDAQWVTAKKDWEEAKRKHKMKEKMKGEEDVAEDNQNESSTQDYDQDMDKMRCILYLHGGGYYFGSVDQERYSIQRHARKINGRVFAVNYRLAPQYPFPCAIQDALASYLYLIRPPPEARHQPVKPGHIVVMGDSAGGGLSLALLQVLRDSGLPLPAGGVLISPWCDLTHSFPSIHTNTATDIIPQYGLSLHRPSLLWPPPSPETAAGIQRGLRDRIRHTLDKIHDHSSSSKLHAVNSHNGHPTLAIPPSPTASMLPVDVGATTPVPTTNPNADPFEDQSQKVTLTTQSGEELMIDQQVQLYTQNNLVIHPLVSSAMSYLGGLPPLFFIASDKEVLRDEAIYAAHKAAHPEKFPIKDEVRALYPALNGIESRYGPTPVHLQVYDDTAHVLPVLFSFTTPAKFCFRAIASFCKYTTGMFNTPHPTTDSLGSGTSGISRASTVKGVRSTKSKSSLRSGKGSFFAGKSSEQKSLKDRDDDDTSNASKLGLKRSISEKVGNINIFSGTLDRKRSLSSAQEKVALSDAGVPPVPPMPLVVSPQPTSPPITGSTPGSSVTATTENDGTSSTSVSFSAPSSGSSSNAPATSNLGIAISRTSSPVTAAPPQIRYAGDPVIYSETAEFPSMKTGMIRERVSTRGVIRPLEPEEELDAMKVPQDMIGTLSELAIRRYLDGSSKYEKKFRSTMKTIEKHRRKNYERAQKDTIKNMSVLQHSLDRETKLKRETAGQTGNTEGNGLVDHHQVKDGLLASSGWSWAWALDDNERPPPSSIVSRRDTSEALSLARIADVQDDGNVMSGNNLWGVINNFLTPGPGKDATSGIKSDLNPREKGKGKKPDSVRSPRRSLFPRIVSLGKSTTHTE